MKKNRININSPHQTNYKVLREGLLKTINDSPNNKRNTTQSKSVKAKINESKDKLIKKVKAKNSNIWYNVKVLSKEKQELLDLKPQEFDPYKSNEEFYKDKSKEIDEFKNFGGHGRLNINNFDVLGELYWAFQLRDYKNKKDKKKLQTDKNAKTEDNNNNDNDNNNDEVDYEKEKIEKMRPPSCYLKGLEAFKKRFGDKTRPKTAVENKNFAGICHLAKNCTSNSSNIQFNFATSLRSFDSNNKKQSIDSNKNKWNNIPLHCNTEYYNDLPSVYKNKIDKEMYVRPYTAIHGKVMVGKNEINRRKFQFDDTKAWNTFGEHKARKDYSTNYHDPNYAHNHEVMKNWTNSECLYSLCLRVSNPMESPKKVKRISKKALYKLREDLIKQKHDARKDIKNSRKKELKNN